MKLLVTRRGFVLGLGTSLVGCGGSKEPASAAPPGDEAPIEFSFAGVEGKPIDAQSLRGRVTVLLFVTTFDIPSQSQAKRLEELRRSHVPRINAVGIIMEAPRYVDLARSYGEVLGLGYPLGMVEKEDLDVHPQLHHVSGVPTWIFLDRQGRIGSAASGPLTPEEIERRVTACE